MEDVNDDSPLTLAVMEAVRPLGISQIIATIIAIKQLAMMRVEVAVVILLLSPSRKEILRAHELTAREYRGLSVVVAIPNHERFAWQGIVANHCMDEHPGIWFAVQP